jgi:EmrB/QacA subfamily drug resistance transporter
VTSCVYIRIREHLEKGLVFMPSMLSRTTLVSLIVASALFMELLDGSIIATALPVIARSLHTDPVRLNVAITAYLFSLALFIPLSGWAADRFGARTVFRSAILIFTVSSVFCGLSQSLSQMVCARLAQGLGGAMMMPVGRLVMLKMVPKDKLVRAMTWLTTPAMIGPVLGPPVGGIIVTYFSWRWIFFINLPIGILGVILVSLFIENIREEKIVPLDVRGFLLMAAALAGLVTSFETVGRNLLSKWAVAGFLIGGILCLAAYLIHARRASAPIVDLSLFRLSTFRASMEAGSLFRIGIGALPFLLTLMLQVGFGMSPLLAGFLTISLALGALLVKFFATFLISNLGFRRMLIDNTYICAISMIACGWFRPTTPHIVILAILLAGSFFRSLQFMGFNTLVFADVPNESMSRATTLFSMLQQLFLSLGVGTGALLLSLTLKWHRQSALSANDFWPAFAIIGIIAAFSIFPLLRLTPDAGAVMSGQKPREPLA